MRMIFLFGTLLTLIVVAGCGGNSSSGLTAQPPGSATRTATGQFQSLRFTATTRTVYQPGEPVTVTFTVTNTGTQPYSYTGGCVTIDDLKVWPQGQNTPLTIFNSQCYEGCSGMATLQLAPGQTRTDTLTWDRKQEIVCGQRQDVPPGLYQIQPIWNQEGVGTDPLTIQLR